MNKKIGINRSDFMIGKCNTDGFYIESGSIFALDYVAKIQSEYKTNQIIVNQTYSVY